jgi:protein involved in polysaccharide export with SLBB domain
MIRRIVIILAVTHLVGCSTTASGNYRDIGGDARDAVQASALGPGDEIAIRVYLHNDLEGTYTVSPVGTIMFPLVGEFTCEGLTAIELASRLRDRLAEGYLRDPQVIVTIKTFNSKKVYVLGQVRKPGRFQYADGMSVVEAVTLAGGFAPLAEKNYTIITRNDRRIPVPVEKIMQGLAKNFLLQPGDIVYIPQTIL